MIKRAYVSIKPKRAFFFPEAILVSRRFYAAQAWYNSFNTIFAWLSTREFPKHIHLSLPMIPQAD